MQEEIVHPCGCYLIDAIIFRYCSSRVIKRICCIVYLLDLFTLKIVLIGTTGKKGKERIYVLLAIKRYQKVPSMIFIDLPDNVTITPCVYLGWPFFPFNGMHLTIIFCTAYFIVVITIVLGFGFEFEFFLCRIVIFYQFYYHLILIIYNIC